ncbi:hypothetical protein [Bacillus sp. T33-2]|uniref:hypothetical protein n=1 Tax=Bacillus sp. T33-2 TaxID=2054168 RepID=UPI000C76F26E|nr:hypothetical protein [Bacillus sp. T33-2]PLR91140.1 hypothetical protein CVD19_21945 [Bacillus sp. T33-2]
MDDFQKMEQLLRNYGYPEDAIERLLDDVADMGYEQAEKRLMPYRDITAEKYKPGHEGKGTENE